MTNEPLARVISDVNRRVLAMETRLEAVEKAVLTGPTVAQSLAKLVVNTDRLAKAANGPYGGETPSGGAT